MEKYKTIHENKVLINPPKENLKIKTKSWDYTCGDGCCTTWGQDVFINNEKVSTGDYNNIELILKEVLEHLGYEIDIDIDYE
jgi:hypothetical protein